MPLNEVFKLIRFYLLLLGASRYGNTEPTSGYAGGPGILFTRRTKRALLTMCGYRATAAITNSATSRIVISIACEIHLYWHYFNFFFSYRTTLLHIHYKWSPSGKLVTLIIMSPLFFALMTPRRIRAGYQQFV